MRMTKLAALVAVVVLTIAACDDGNNAVATPVSESPAAASPAAVVATPASGSTPANGEATQEPVVTAEPSADDGGS